MISGKERLLTVIKIISFDSHQPKRFSSYIEIDNITLSGKRLEKRGIAQLISSSFYSSVAIN